MILIASKLFDLEGYAELELRADNSGERLQRRFNKVATLDLGSTINDRGFSDSDREMTLAYANQSRELDATLERFVRLHARVLVSKDGELLECAPVALDKDSERPTFTLSVIQKLGA